MAIYFLAIPIVNVKNTFSQKNQKFLLCCMKQYLLPLLLLYACSSGKKLPSSNIITGSADSIITKYASYLNTDKKFITNTKLYSFIDIWLKTPYRWGGTTEKGIDCSAFIQKLLSEVYSITIPRTSIQQFFSEGIEPFSSQKALTEGDLVFFQTLDKTIVSHVGLYLQNNMFVNSSSSKGVSIASLSDPYWKKRFVAAGRLKRSYIILK